MTKQLIHSYSTLQIKVIPIMWITMLTMRLTQD